MPKKEKQIPELLPPYDEQSEEALLGSILIDETVLVEAAPIVTPADFYRDRNRWLYQAFLGLRDAKQPIDQVSASKQLETDGKLAEAGGPAFLSHLVISVPTSVHAKYYADRVHGLAQRRTLIEKAGKIAGQAYDVSVPFEQVLDNAAEAIRIVRMGANVASRSIVITGMTKVQMSPPHYDVEINGQKLKVGISTLLNWRRMKQEIVANLDFVPTQPESWDKQVDAWLRRAEKEEAPKDASANEQLKLAVQRWLEVKGAGEQWSDIQSGCYLLREKAGRQFYCFQVSRLLDWLRKEGRNISAASLYMVAREWGAQKWRLRVKAEKGSMPLELWAIPLDFQEAEPPQEIPDWF